MGYGIITGWLKGTHSLEMPPCQTCPSTPVPCSRMHLWSRRPPVCVGQLGEHWPAELPDCQGLHHQSHRPPQQGRAGQGEIALSAVISWCALTYFSLQAGKWASTRLGFKLGVDLPKIIKRWRLTSSLLSQSRHFTLFGQRDSVSSVSQSRWLIEHSVSLINQCLSLFLVLMSISGVQSVLKVSDVQPPQLGLGHQLRHLNLIS